MDRAKYLVKSPVNAMAVSCLTPLPGTRVFEEFLKEGRLTATNYPEDWVKYNFFHTVFKPKRMFEQELTDVYKKASQYIFSKKNLRKIYLMTLIRTRSRTIARWAYYTNLHMSQALYISK
jgi:hypothetical protein